MSYEKYYPGGWQSGEAGATPITPEALNYMEDGIANSAPAGYGLGQEASTLRTKAELDAVKGNGFFLHNGEAVLDHPSAQYNGQCVGGVLSIKHGASCTQFFILNYPNKGAVLKRDSWDDVTGWAEWEWVNPPMAPGVEYRTTERWNEKPVYVQAINVGAMPNTTTKRITVVTHSANIQVVDIWGVLKTAGNAQYDFNLAGADLYIEYTGSNPNLAIRTASDMSAQTGIAYLKYTK